MGILLCPPLLGSGLLLELGQSYNSVVSGIGRLLEPLFFNTVLEGRRELEPPSVCHPGTSMAGASALLCVIGIQCGLDPDLHSSWLA